MSKEVYIVAAVRTPIGSFGGCLSSLSSTQLGAIAIKAAVEKINLNPDLVDEVIMGAVMQAGLGQAPARQASKGAGLPDKVIATTDKDLNELIQDKLKPFTAYMSGRIEIEGDLQDVFKLKKLIKSVTSVISPLKK